MIKAAVITPWAGSGTDDERYHFKILDDYQIHAWKDVTGQPNGNLPPDPNLLTAQIICTSEVLSAIEADPTYHVLWSFDL